MKGEIVRRLEAGDDVGLRDVGNLIQSCKKAKAALDRLTTTSREERRKMRPGPAKDVGQRHADEINAKEVEEHHQRPLAAVDELVVTLRTAFSDSQIVHLSGLLKEIEPDDIVRRLRI